MTAVSGDASQQVQRFVERALALRDRRDEAVSAEELEAIAREIGLSDADLQAVAEAVDKDFKQGAQFLEHGLVDDAVRELTSAAALAPSRVDVAVTLAQAYLKRWQRSGGDEDRAQAERIARACIELDADCADAYRVIDALQNPETGGRRLAVTIAAAVLLGGGLLGFLATRSSPPPKDDPGAGEGAPTAAAARTPPPVPKGPHKLFPGKQGALPVLFEPGTVDGHLALELHTSKWTHYDTGGGKDWYELRAIGRNVGDKDLRDVEVEVEALDATDEGVGAGKERVANGVWLRPKETVAIRKLVPATGRPATAVVNVAQAQLRPAANPSTPDPQAAVVWNTEVPQGRAVEFRLRAEQTPATTTTEYVALTFAVTNSGQRPIKHLVGQVVMRSGGKWREEEVEFVPRENSPLSVGETRLVSFHDKVGSSSQFEHELVINTIR